MQLLQLLDGAGFSSPSSGWEGKGKQSGTCSCLETLALTGGCELVVGAISALPLPQKCAVSNALLFRGNWAQTLVTPTNHFRQQPAARCDSQQHLSKSTCLVLC